LFLNKLPSRLFRRFRTLLSTRKYGKHYKSKYFQIVNILAHQLLTIKIKELIKYCISEKRRMLLIEKASSKNKAITVIGIVVPVDWDENGNPVTVAVSSNNEQEFIIENRNKKGKEVEKLLRQKVRVSGDLRDSKGSRKKIRIKSYTKLDDNHTREKDNGILKVTDISNPLNEQRTSHTPSHPKGWELKGVKK
jgi:hypothetical protein